MDDDGKRQGAKRIAARNSEFQKWHRFRLGHVMVAHANILKSKKNKEKEIVIEVLYIAQIKIQTLSTTYH
jgi:hypothetical protein